jgi:putative flavoprotein involved in K+ transport
MSITSEDGTPAVDAEAVAGAWVASLDRALADGDFGAIDGLFVADGWWRDLLALTWDFEARQGHAAIKALLQEHAVSSGIAGLRLVAGKPPVLVEPEPGTRWIQGFHAFRTDLANGRGSFRLVEADGEWRASLFLTDVASLIGHEERRTTMAELAGAALTEAAPGRRSWAEQRQDQIEFVDAEPAVLIVGAGQAGLAVAARLSRLGIQALIVDRNPRVGDNWRHRYRNLNLHDPFWTNHLPYLPFPDHWPVVTPKDKLADWLEFYAKVMDLNVWTGTTVLDGAFDDETLSWTVTLRREDGTERTVHPSHVVIATGHSGVANIPEIPGMADFRGTVHHSQSHAGAEAYAGRRAVVVGTGSSAHDVAQDFVEQGADTTMVQRGPCYVMSLKNGVRTLNWPVFSEEGPPAEEADLMGACTPIPVLVRLLEDLAPVIEELDREMIDGLDRVGFLRAKGGLLSGKFGSGYYIDQGASKLIGDGTIKLAHGGVERFVQSGVVLADGTTIEADVVVLCTGYKDLKENARALLGDRVADRLEGPLYQPDEQHELRGVWRDSGHPRLFFMVGSLAQCRFHSHHLALQIKALEEGLYEQRSGRALAA